MSRGPIWTDDENRILKYMWDNRDQNAKDVEVDAAIAKVLTRRDPDAINIHRRQKGLVRKKQVRSVNVRGPTPVLKFIAPEKERADNLPDIGEQVAKLIEKQTLIEQTLWSINVKLTESNDLMRSSVQASKESLELWRTIDARGKTSKQS